MQGKRLPESCVSLSKMLGHVGSQSETVWKFQSLMKFHFLMKGKHFA